MKMEVLNTSNSNLSHAGTSPPGSVETSNVLESMKQQFLQGTENVPENVINGKLGIDDKAKQKKKPRSRRAAGQSPKGNAVGPSQMGNKRVNEEEKAMPGITPKVSAPVVPKVPETPTSPLSPGEHSNPLAVIQRKFFSTQTNSLTKGLRGIRKTDESPTKTDPRSPITSPLLPPVVTPFSIPSLNSSESPAVPVIYVSRENKLEESIGDFTTTNSLGDLTEKIKDFTKNLSNKANTPKITRTTGTPRGASKDVSKNTTLSLLIVNSTESRGADPVTPTTVTPISGEKLEESVDDFTSTNLSNTESTPKITRASKSRGTSKDRSKLANDKANESSIIDTPKTSKETHKVNIKSKLANDKANESIIETPKTSKESHKVNIKSSLRDIKLLGKETPRNTKETTRSVSRESLTRSTSRESLNRSTSRENLTRSVSKENLRSSSRESLTRSISKENLKITDKDNSKSFLKDTPKVNLKESTKSISKDTPKVTIKDSLKVPKDSPKVPSKETPKSIPKELTPKFVSKLVAKEVLSKDNLKAASKELTTKDALKSVSEELNLQDTLKSVSKEISSILESKEDSLIDSSKSVKEVSLKDVTKSISKEVTQKDIKKSISKDSPQKDIKKSISKDSPQKDSAKSVFKEVTPKDTQKLILKDSPKAVTKIIQKISLKQSTKTNSKNIKPLTKSDSLNETTIKHSQLRGPMKALFKKKPPTLKVGTQKIGAPKSTLKSKKHGLGKGIFYSLKKPLRSAMTKELISNCGQMENKVSTMTKKGRGKRSSTKKVLLKKVEQGTYEKKLEKVSDEESISVKSLEKKDGENPTVEKKSTTNTNEKKSASELVEKKINNEKVLPKRVEQNISEKKLDKVGEKESISAKSIEKKEEVKQSVENKSATNSNEKKSASKVLEKKAIVPINNPDLDESIQLASDTLEPSPEGRRTRGRPAKRKAEMEIEAQQNSSLGKSVTKANSAATQEGKMTTTLVVDVHNSMSGEPQITLVGVHGAQVGKKRRVVSPAKLSNKTSQVDEKPASATTANNNSITTTTTITNAAAAITLNSNNSNVPIPKDSSFNLSLSASSTKILPVRATRDRSKKSIDATDKSNALSPKVQHSSSSNELQFELKDALLSGINHVLYEKGAVGNKLVNHNVTPETSKTSATSLVTPPATPKNISMQKYKSITPIFVPRKPFVSELPKTSLISSVANSNTSKIINIAPKPTTLSPQIVPIMGPISPKVPITSTEVPFSLTPKVSVVSPLTLFASKTSIISVTTPVASPQSMPLTKTPFSSQKNTGTIKASNISLKTPVVSPHCTASTTHFSTPKGTLSTKSSVVSPRVVTSEVTIHKGLPLTFVPVSLSPIISKSLPSIPQNTITTPKSLSSKDVPRQGSISPAPSRSLIQKAISLEDITRYQTIPVHKSPSLKDLSKLPNTSTDKTKSIAPATSVPNVASSSINKASPRKKPNLLAIADTLMAKKLPEAQKSSVQKQILNISLSKEKSAVDEIKEKAALAKKDLVSNETGTLKKTISNVVHQEKRTSSPSPSMPSLEKVSIGNVESSPVVDKMPLLDRMKDSPLRELSITTLSKQTSDENANATKQGNSRLTVETHSITVSVAKASSDSPDSESKDTSKSKKKVPRFLKQLYQDEGVQNMLSSLEVGATENETEETGPHKLRPKRATDPNIGAILDSDIDELILMHNQQTMMNKKKKRPNELDNLYKDEGVLNLLTSLDTTSKRISGQFDDSESDISSTSGKSARQVKTLPTEVSVTETRKRRLSGTSTISDASSASMKPPDAKKAKHVGRESTEDLDLEEIEESTIASKEEVILKRGRGRPALPEHVKQKNKAMRMQLQLQKEGREVTVSRPEENGHPNTIPQVEFIRLPKDGGSKTTKLIGPMSPPTMQGTQYIPPIKFRLPSGDSTATQQVSATDSLQGVSRSVTITPISSTNSASRTVSPKPQHPSQPVTLSSNNKAQPSSSKTLPQLVRRPGSPDKLQQQLPQGKRVEIGASPNAAS
ncbi:unnamed protein product, partial [Meganyctiphanes norvegica]